MSEPKQSPNSPPEKFTQKKVESSKPQAEDLFHHSAKNIDSSVRPIIESVESKIASDFLKLHNTYLLQGFKRKVDCYEKFIMSQPPLVEEKIKKNEKPKNTSLSPQTHLSYPQTKATPQQVLQYYDCFDAEINLGNQRYQKIYKKSQQNKQRLISCIERCSGHSKQSKQQFQKCAQGCKDSYTETITKLYTNFYNKFLDKNH